MVRPKTKGSFCLGRNVLVAYLSWLRYLSRRLECSQSVFEKIRHHLRKELRCIEHVDVPKEDAELGLERRLWHDLEEHFVNVAAASELQMVQPPLRRAFSLGLSLFAEYLSQSW